MKVLVTGVAGFIGSTLAELLISKGAEVRGVDCFTPYYEEAAKRANLTALLEHKSFELVEADLRLVDCSILLDDVEIVFHLAGQPGVRLSWAEGFIDYAEHNILATQRLLEAACRVPLKRFVYASSSSVYGNAPVYPTSEDMLPAPHSPYGMTKLGAEHLCRMYGSNFAIPTISLGYFSVFGPRQRPDMGLHRLIEAAQTGQQFHLFGTGEQVRDFTYVGDIARATVLAGSASLATAPPGSVLNIAGGDSITMNGLLELVGDVVGQPLNVRREGEQAGDVARTGGTIDMAAQLLGWRPDVDIRTGAENQAAWHAARRMRDTGTVS